MHLVHPHRADANRGTDTLLVAGSQGDRLLVGAQRGHEGQANRGTGTLLVAEVDAKASDAFASLWLQQGDRQLVGHGGDEPRVLVRLDFIAGSAPVCLRPHSWQPVGDESLPARPCLREGRAVGHVRSGHPPFSRPSGSSRESVRVVTRFRLGLCLEKSTHGAHQHRFYFGRDI